MKEFLGDVERVVSAHLGVPWRATGFTDLRDRASHPCGIFRGDPISIFAKLNTGGETPAELRGLQLLRRHAVAVPNPIAAVRVTGGALLLQEALPEVPAQSRTNPQWAAMGSALGALHNVHGSTFGLPDFDGFFGPLPQDNTPADDWPTFYAARRLMGATGSAAGRLGAW
jgi:fructosamine-3-kinase